MPRKLKASALSATSLSDKLGYTPVSPTDLNTAVANLVNSSPSTLDTLNELATALGNDANFATTTATALGNKVNKSGDTMTGPLVIKQSQGAAYGGWATALNLNGYFPGYDENAVRATIDSGIPTIGTQNTTFGQLALATRGSDGLNRRLIVGAYGTISMPYQPAFLAAGVTGSYAPNALIGFANKLITSARATNFNASTSLFTAPVDGAYYFGYIIWVYATSTYVQISFKKNGTDYAPSGSDSLISMNGNPGVNGSAISMTSNVVIELAAGDTIGVGVRVGGLGSATVSVYGGHSHFYGHLVG
jgi:hypothetical protein